MVKSDHPLTSTHSTRFAHFGTSSMDVKYSMIFIFYYLQLRDNLEPFQPDWQHFVDDRDEWNQIDKISMLVSYMDSLRH